MRVLVVAFDVPFVFEFHVACDNEIDVGVDVAVDFGVLMIDV